jgi:CubicO group peptidase (beta-lactamase class C family)
MITPDFSARRLARLDDFLAERYLAPGRLPGALVLVHRHGRTAHLSVQGKADLATGRPLAEDTIFRIYSMTKPVTSLAFMMLVEEGKVALDDPVHRFIPEWRKLAVRDAASGAQLATRPTDRPMRMVDLLRHTSGLTYGFQHRTPVDAAYRARRIGDHHAEGGLDRMIADLAQLPLEFSPGAAWNYSVSTDVLGYLIGKISGQPFDEFLRQRLFAPLGMTDTDFHVPAEKRDRFCACYQATAQGGMALHDPWQDSVYYQPPALISGGGGLVSTAGDYLKFCRLLLGRGTVDGVTYVGRKTFELMTANHLPGGADLHGISVSLFSEATYAGVGFGLGFAVTLDPARTLAAGSPGDCFWGGMASTYFWIDPVEDLAVVFMTQLMPSAAYPIRRQLRTLVYAALDAA